MAGHETNHDPEGKSSTFASNTASAGVRTAPSPHPLGGARGCEPARYTRNRSERGEILINKKRNHTAPGGTLIATRALLGEARFLGACSRSHPLCTLPVPEVVHPHPGGCGAPSPVPGGPRTTPLGGRGQPRLTIHDKTGGRADKNHLNNRCGPSR